MNNWSVIRTRSRWEKKVIQLLTEKGIETFCPLLKSKRQWSDRVKVIEEPLLKSYVFVRVNDDQRTNVRITEGVMNFVYREGKLLVIKEKVIESIRQLQQTYPNVEVIENGAQTDNYLQLSKLNGEKNKAVTLSIEGLDLVLLAYHDHTELN